jgi:hypothetical protein
MFLFVILIKKIQHKKYERNSYTVGQCYKTQAKKKSNIQQPMVNSQFFQATVKRRYMKSNMV